MFLNLQFCERERRFHGNTDKRKDITISISWYQRKLLCAASEQLKPNLPSFCPMYICLIFPYI